MADDPVAISSNRMGNWITSTEGMLIRTYRDLNKASGHLTHMRSPEAERNSPI